MADLALVRRYHDALIGLRARTGVQVGAIWDLVGGLDEASLVAFQVQASRVALGGQVAASRLVSAYLGQYLGTAAAVDVASVSGAAVRNGTAPEAVYGRAVVMARTAVSRGASLSQALAQGRARAVSAAETDVMLANRAAASEIMRSDSRVVGYERVLSGGSCDLCAIASTQRYHTEDLMPIHNRCDCGVVPILEGSDNDSGQIINRDRYRELKKSGAIDKVTAQRKASAARDVATRNHGELGPVLTDAAHDFTAEADLNA